MLNCYDCLFTPIMLFVLFVFIDVTFVNMALSGKNIERLEKLKIYSKENMPTLL